MHFGIPAVDFRRLVREVSEELTRMDRPDVSRAFAEAARRVRGG